MDVVTTSGPGTGEAADRAKIAALRSGAPDAPLAIASGITPENVRRYADLADCFLVASGISESFAELDPGRTAALVERVRSNPGRIASEIRSLCFVCEWNEGRSPHLAYRVRNLLGSRGSEIRITSAGLTQGGTISHRRREFLIDRGVRREELEQHRSSVFDERHAAADLVLVAELPMKDRLQERWPELEGRVMSVRGFARGLLPEEDLSVDEAHVEDSGGHELNETLALYEELEGLARDVTVRLAGS
jgi:protein-tyrosine-phosphatase